jgi:hypothetical protein
MSANRRRHANVLPIASISMWIIICASLLGAGLGYVWLKNQLHTSAAEVKRLEREIAQVDMRIDVVKGEIEKWAAQPALKRRYEGDKTRLGGLVDIQPDRVVYVDRPIPVITLDPPDIQQASNQR